MMIIMNRLKSKASKSQCKYKVGAVGFNKRGEIIGFGFNRPRFSRLGGSIHAEMWLMLKYGKRLKEIVVCRVNKTGDVKPIDPCAVCAAKAKELGIKLHTVLSRQCGFV